ncbi:MAG: M23 family metallopeptidase, partial [Acidimicrobiales bacterium]|nr:M23 family metallopeptidase [Acidimicrobiales bacterium]
AGSGTVIFTGWRDGYGNTVIIDHGGGISTLYAHLSQISISNGASVTPGSSVGLMGATGLVTGPHLHFEVRLNGTAVDPLAYLP